MINKLHSNVRLVKCPKCAKILPEPEEVPLYTCGGCGTILQAKYCRRNSKATASGSRKVDAVQSNGLSNASDDGESSNSSQRASSSGEQASSQNEGREQTVAENCNSEQNGAANSARHTSVSEQSSFLENKGNGEIDNKTDQFENKESELTSENTATEDYNDDGHDEECDGIAVENHNQKQIGDVNYARENPAVEESQVLGNKESEQLATVNETIEDHQHKRVGEEPMQLAPENQAENNGLDHDMSKGTADMDLVSKHSGEDISGNEINCHGADNPVELANLDAEPMQLALANQAECNGSDHVMSKETRDMHLVGKQSCEDMSENDINCRDADNPVKLANLGEQNCNRKDKTDFVEHTREQLENVKLSSEAPRSTEITRGGNDDSTSGNHSVSAPSRATDLKSSQEIGTTNVFKNPLYGSNSLDKVRETSRRKIENLGEYAVSGSQQLKAVPPRSPTKKSIAYDGSVSSLEGNDDQVPEQQELMGDKTLPVNDGVPGYVGTERSPEWSNHTSERRTHRRLMLLKEKLKSSMDEPLRMTRPNRDSFRARVPQYRRSSELAFETGSSSGYMHRDEPPIHWMHNRAYRGAIDRRRFPEAAWRESEFLPMYYNYETSGEIYHRSRYRGYNDRRRRAESWSLSNSLPQMPYSGEMFGGRYEIRDPYYVHRHPNDLRLWSAELPPPPPPPPPPVYSRQGWDPYDSYPTSPRQMVDPDYSYGWAHDTISLSDDQRHEDQLMRRLYLKKKRRAVEKHFRPVAGGAPFISCYLCFNVLQLPGKFLRSRKTHKLKCGACSSVLEFSLENDSILAPYKNVRLASSSHVNGEKMEGLHDGASAARSNSPLHRLMGYSSPKELLTGHNTGDVE